MNRTLIIHVVSEVVIIVACMTIVFKKFKTQQDQLTELTEIVKKQEDTIAKCMAHIKELYSILNPSSQRRSLQEAFMYQQPNMDPLFNHHKIQPSHASHASHPSHSLYPSQNSSQQQHSQGNKQQSPEKNSSSMMSSLFNIVPTMLSLGSKNNASMIIAELEKPAEEKKEVMNVEVFDDPDIDEALNDDSDTHPQSHQEENNITEQSSEQLTLKNNLEQ